MRKIFLLFLSVAGMAIILYLYRLYCLSSSFPTIDKMIVTNGIDTRITITFDDNGIPRIDAITREDSYFSLGYISGRDRLFQMDLLRQRSSGRLAEIFAPKADRMSRTIGFEKIVSSVLAELPMDKADTLNSYSRGANNAAKQFTTLHLEFLTFDYQPDPWRQMDSLLLLLGLYVDLGGNWEKEISATIMKV